MEGKSSVWLQCWSSVNFPIKTLSYHPRTSSSWNDSYYVNKANVLLALCISQCIVMLHKLVCNPKAGNVVLSK
ncbi:hypothetical protein T12_16440 [Trichinella patagoniensis]|uniref:Uncharacterized protein n=1 Tax=Trichinella patagoniensis TaxID=990121 RepID=A0A0V0ZNT3_9BILA|nr:hypothetical protein T12_16440 [Trichinella patagoniensis]